MKQNFSSLSVGRHLIKALVLAGFLAGAPVSFAQEGPAPGFAGQFLAGHFAQSENDWEQANGFLGTVLEKDPQNQDLLKRSMILAMGAGDIDLASRRAHDILKAESGNGLARLIVVVRALSAGDMKDAAAQLAQMPEGDITDFVRPMIAGWMDADKPMIDPGLFNVTTVHSYSGGMLALYKKDMASVAVFAQRMLEAGGLSLQDAERAGDLFAIVGDKEKALALYQGAYDQNNNNSVLERKITALKNNDRAVLEKYIAAYQIKRPAQGVAVAMYDMARLLFQEQNDSSAKLFAHMALALDPDMTETRLMLADSLVREGRYDEAISFLSGVPQQHESWLTVQRYKAELLHQAGRTGEGVKLLNDLFIKHDDVESLIRVGDIYRTKADYEDALKAYNRAARYIGKTVPEEYWYLLYARGMVYEREGDWRRAESDLKAALVYRPDHPYLLNYLGYGWADQGKNLEESLRLIERAAALRPNDGSIADSLGWVLYKMGRYDDAVSHLESAVGLMPYDATVNDHLGDAYWQVGRKLEARFQWERALNNAAGNESLKVVLRQKMAEGIETAVPVKEAARVPDQESSPH